MNNPILFGSHQQSHFGRFLLAASCAAAFAAGCGSGDESELGSVELALSGSSAGSEYELLDATFQIEGASSTTLSSDGSGATLQTELPVGAYTVLLDDGWRLVEVNEGVQTEVVATLLSDNPAAFSIEADQVTDVDFVFQTDDGTVTFGEGTLALGIEVQKLVRRQVVFSELMKNPVALADADGEWIELANVGSEPVSLEGCEVRRDDTGFTIGSALSVEPGARAVLANSDAPGFVPSYVYTGLTLPNTGAFTLTLVCGEETLDSVVVDPALVSNAAGAALSLDPSAETPTANDDALSWCNAVGSYNGDLGSPGTANPACP